MLQGETVGHADGVQCPDCKKMLTLSVCKSAAGFYLGYFCQTCGPYSRESDYFDKREDAQKALQSENKPFREPGFHPGGLEVLSGDEALKALGVEPKKDK